MFAAQLITRRICEFRGVGSHEARVRQHRQPNGCADSEKVANGVDRKRQSGSSTVIQNIVKVTAAAVQRLRAR